ncbi:hypothetical protein G7Y89_g2664 [Cudoniella acicularis]|uniref:Uncharacterized protein n=1 Tax=Cudoniella acicularis TaxID=354080 RepID=A0A8H4RSZ4_9HELO|nr:hypothetical protein G7Y89_g2664 [Cudoniella acicularis]
MRLLVNRIYYGTWIHLRREVASRRSLAEGVKRQDLFHQLRFARNRNSEKNITAAQPPITTAVTPTPIQNPSPSPQFGQRSTIMDAHKIKREPLSPSQTFSTTTPRPHSGPTDNSPLEKTKVEPYSEESGEHQQARINEESNSRKSGGPQQVDVKAGFDWKQHQVDVSNGMPLTPKQAIQAKQNGDYANYDYDRFILKPSSSTKRRRVDGAPPGECGLHHPQTHSIRTSMVNNTVNTKLHIASGGFLFSAWYQLRVFKRPVQIYINLLANAIRPARPKLELQSPLSGFNLRPPTTAANAEINSTTQP